MMFKQIKGLDKYELMNLFNTTKEDRLVIKYKERNARTYTFSCLPNDSYGIDEIAHIVRRCNAYKLDYHIYTERVDIGYVK